MAKTTLISKKVMADWHNVAWALHRACLGKNQTTAVQIIQSDADSVIEQVSSALLQGRLPVGRFHRFMIYDPKKRLIHAAPIQDRIAHHAIIHFLEPTFEQVLLPAVFACRVGKGVHAAIHYAQRQSRRFRWVMHVDIKHYFPNIDHQILTEQLEHRFRGDGLQLIEAIINSYNSRPGKGLPIGALSSQHFANHYLNIVDRWSLAQPGIAAFCRYMDDYLFWSNEKNILNHFKQRLAEFINCQLALSIKQPVLQRTDIGLLFCGIHIKPFKLKPGLRRRRRYFHSVTKWQRQWQQGQINALQLQRSYDAAAAILLPADDRQFRQRYFQAKGAVDA